MSAGIQNILYILRNSTKYDTTFVYQWAKNKGRNWQEFLIEALCIVQSYHITEKLHLDMKNLEEVFLPYRCGTSLFINPNIKCLYLMMEKMSQEETDSVITYMRERSSSNFESVKNSNQYIELYILDWMRVGLIEVHDEVSPNITLLRDFLKEFEINDALEALQGIKMKKSVTVNSNDHEMEKERVGVEKLATTISSDAAVENDRYKIRRETCGYVLIINQKVFSKPSPDKIPAGVQIEEYLGVRLGTDADCELIRNTFKKRGYQIVQHDNLAHVEMQKALNDIVCASVIYDSLIVCILSHGNTGVVFGADYIPVKISTIQEILSSERLLNKPKLLIIQACQGKEKNVRVNPESSMRTNTSMLETDGPSEPNSAPKYADLLTANSTISGYVSVRDKRIGTWYINEICNIINERGDDDHMLDLLTYVNSKVSEKRHMENDRELCMLPEFSVRLLKKFYLPKKV